MFKIHFYNVLTLDLDIWFNVSDRIRGFENPYFSFNRGRVYFGKYSSGSQLDIESISI